MKFFTDQTLSNKKNDGFILSSNNNKDVTSLSEASHLYIYISLKSIG